jgi:hypothetical protein
MEGFLLLIDVAAVVFLVYWVVAYDTDGVKAQSRGFFAFIESFGPWRPKAKRRLTFQEERMRARDE